MRIGFAKTDITPRVGVPLCGFGPFLNRVSLAIRDHLWARAMAFEHKGERAVVVSCDLVGIIREDTDRARQLVHEATGMAAEAMMISCTHTHSGPDTSPRRIGWGGYDPPYMELLPRRIAAAAIQALERLTEATLSHAEVPCEGIGLNRECDKDAPPLEDVLRDDWRPARPELTDTTCHVAKAEADGEIIGFFSYFGCHPVCCCSQTRQIHGDFVGVATNMLEREHPGSIGLFLQGAQGDVNSCVVHKPEQEALLALDVIAARYANAVRVGLAQAQPLDLDVLRATQRRVTFSQRQWSAEELRERLAREEAVLCAAEADDADRDYRMAVVRALALRRILAQVERGEAKNVPLEVQGIRIGPLALLASPFETFQAIKNEVRDKAKSAIPLVLGVSNDSGGYAPDRNAAERGGYAADVVPMIHGHSPYDRLFEELPAALLAVDDALQ